MAAYLISDATARDVGAFESRRARGAASIPRYGGPVKAVERVRAPCAVATVEFPYRERAWPWYLSPEYDGAPRTGAEAGRAPGQGGSGL
jgi:uncharacterized protein (DUF1330 family)